MVTYLLVDVLIFILVTYFFIKGFQKGVIVELSTIIGLIIGVLAAMELINLVVNYFKTWFGSSPWLPYIGYLVIFLGVFFLIQLLGKAIEKILKLTQLNFLNRLSGGLISILKIVFFISLVYWLSDQAALISSAFKAKAFSYQLIEPIAPVVMEKLSDLIPILKDGVQELETIFAELQKKLS